MNNEQRENADRLSKLSGREFDRKYVKFEAKDHREAIKYQKEQMKKNGDPELEQFASKEVETVIAHKQKVDMLQVAIQ